MIKEIRNLLILAPEHRDIFLDLYALNLQRSADHGLSDLNTVRKAYGLKPLENFEEMTSDSERVAKLKNIYKTPNYCDLWVAILCEDSIEGGVLGELGAKIVGEMFGRIRDGDRFWYEKEYPASVVAEIGVTTLAEVFMRNTGIKSLQENIFLHTEE